MAQFKFDKRNYRKHNEKNKNLIKKSLEECGAGRSILVDANNEIIAGNGVFEQAQKMNMPIKVVESDGSEIIAVKRTDLKTSDDKRTKLAILDNSTADTSEFDYALLQKDFDLQSLGEFGIDPIHFEIEKETTDDGIFDNLPEELTGRNLTPDELQKIVGEDATATERIIITYKPEEKDELEHLLGLKIDKVVFDAKELFQANGME